jgi:hypothetical protein
VKYLATWEISQIRGPAVAIDVVRAFTTAAFAFAPGAARSSLAISGRTFTHGAKILH